MLEIVGYFLFLFAGLFFGLFGSGGSIIIIPILIYIFQLSIYEATSYSLLLVCLISIFGTIKHVKHNNLHIKRIIFFIIPTLFFTAISRVFLFPNIPEHIEILNISKDSLLMVLFSIVIFLSGFSIFKFSTINLNCNFKTILILIGIIIGLLTGLLGIGGGFIIAPALILFANMNMKESASSTLFIIMLNTLLAIFLELTIFKFQFEFTFIVLLLLFSLVGVLVGMYLLNKINLKLIRKMFSITLLLLSLVIFCIELL
tara:strand:- start:185 stop:958 length:774 start_codon:yes stop_codon:yes gene_type:complete